MRKDYQLPKFYDRLVCRTGAVSQAVGSAYIELRNTKIICAVYGPREVAKKQEFNIQATVACELKFATFSCRRRRRHIQDSQEKEYSQIIVQALQPVVRLDKYPKSQIDIFITVLQNDGSVLGGAITAASVALADSGIEIFDVAIGCCLRQIGDLSLIDPTYLEEEGRLNNEEEDEIVTNANVTIALLPSLNQVSALIMNGELDVDSTQRIIKDCLEGCIRIYPVVRECLTKSLEEKMSRN
ncbi:uncharacterized protein TRIADDRAFT_61054 [Trichoplax adhaerens]|uniref:Exosome complex component MTR3 n=1 Tax=Trichoplax adhaerens TaxID=10228 RepID=B3S9X0_TRIAD|nr:hypothetical protein TRIADDRAFT_61054 [Trichoplax adhaerens]EDV20340.1 hypothetical protein TRIADDRAFT_61054 [Trichoplax adhaerens]|eukprot:XP_002117034.1 hypothetical protein TRIADDRAFT_61054 [Trichoplax adhaerens]